MLIAFTGSAAVVTCPAEFAFALVGCNAGAVLAKRIANRIALSAPVQKGL